MSASQIYPVYKIKLKLSIQDPDMPSPRYHTILFVQTNAQGPGSGIKHHVTGDIVTGMHYEPAKYEDPEMDENFFSKELLGHTRALNYPKNWNDILKSIPAPPKQKAFNRVTMKTEPVKSWDPVTFYELGEPRRPLIKCTEWIEDQAIPILINAGLIQWRHEHPRYEGLLEIKVRMNYELSCLEVAYQVGRHVATENATGATKASGYTHTSSMNPFSILAQLASTGKAFKENVPGSREALIAQSRALVATLEIPSEFIQRTFWAEPAQSAIIRLAVDVHLFQYLHEASPEGLSPTSLSEKTGVDVNLLTRLARHLVAMNVLAFHSGAFHGTTLSNGLVEERYQHSILFCYDATRPSLNGLPAYFKQNAYRSPKLGGTDGPFQYAHGTDLRFFDWVVEKPPQLRHFDSFMSAYRAGKAYWFEEGFYPVLQRLVCGFDAEVGEALLVDVGGGRGHDVTAFVEMYGNLPGKVILQDREAVVASILECVDGRAFEVQAYDFFTPQPVKGARAYFLHSVLHDWCDEDGVQILKNLVPALVRGYSRVLINEIVVNEEKPTLAATSMDMMMLSHLSVRERTEVEWRWILKRVGLRVVRIYTYPGVAESLIEAELV
ncbi:O-methyltransferase, family 2 [Penicillium italicum]|uniref:O-methyltransferase, family 2 n=1 Tax=Penicillium italicum TaxID=40296 RepID=A0A0A2LG56_PENIT|nr:O-methyltransferase, family 2 [Penicillium italicum]